MKNTQGDQDDTPHSAPGKQQREQHGQSSRMARPENVRKTHEPGAYCASMERWKLRRGLLEGIDYKEL